MPAEAASLGKINVLSDLGQPLNAEITLLPASPEELTSIQASIASKEVFAAQGMERAELLSDVKITVGTRADGQPVLKLSSTAPISQPVTDMLVQVDWGTGSLTRLYTLVLEPAAAESAPAQVAVPAVPAETAASDAGDTSEALPDEVPEEATIDDDLTRELPLEELPAPDEAATDEDNQDQQEQDDLTAYVPMDGETDFMTKDDDTAAAAEQPAEQAAPAEAPAEAATEELPPAESTMEDIPPTEDVAINDDLTAEIPMEQEPAETPAETPIVGEAIKSEYAVGKGDTLRNIAVEMWQPNVSLEQMMVGLYNANPQAFENNDMNRLKKGRILRAPTAEELSAIDQASAEQEVQAQVKNWNTYRNKVAGTVAKSAPTKDDNQPSSKVSGKITSVHDQSEATGPRDVVKLSSGTPGAGSAKGKQTKAQMQEQLVADQKALTESNERIALLQKQLQDAQQLLALRDQAAAQQKEGAGGKDAKATGGMQTMVEQLQKDPKVVPKAAGLLAVLFALWLLLHRKKDTKAKKAEAPTSAVVESEALASPEPTIPEAASSTVDSAGVSATDLVQEMQQAMQAADSAQPASTAEQEMVEAMAAAGAAEGAEPESEPSWADAGMPLPEESATPKTEEAEPSWADAGMPLPEEPATQKAEEAEPSWADAGMPLPEEPATQKTEEAEPSWADAGMPLPQEPAAAAMPEAVAATEDEDQDVLSMDDVELLMPEEFEPTEGVEEPVVALEPEPEHVAPEPAAESAMPEPEPMPSMPTAMEMPAAVADDAAAEEALDMDAIFDSGGSLADMVADLPEQTPAEEAASEKAEEAAMDEMVAAAMEEGGVDAENQFDLDDVFGDAAAQTVKPEPAQTAEAVADEEEMSADGLADLLPEEDGEEEVASAEGLADLLPEDDGEDDAATAEVAADDHTEALAAAFDESATKDLQGLDFGFDVDLGEVAADAPVTKAPLPEPEPEPEPKKAAAKKTAAKKPAAKKSKKVDVEDIDLDVAGNGAEAAAAPKESDGSAEIDTMLDLVTAYIDMSDEEGARDLLKEILEKGGPEQKAKAQKMLDDLG